MAESFIISISYLVTKQRPRSTQRVAVHGYTNNSFPVSISEQDIYSITYYDTYDFDSLVYDYIPYAGFDADNFDKVKGQITATKVKILGKNNYLTTVNFYDKKYRVIQVQAENMLGGDDIITNEYDFTGKVLKTKHDHATTVNTVVTWKYFTYDHVGRMTIVEQEIEGDANGRVTMAELSYNDLGEMITKRLHKTATGDYLQTLNYTYNIRGWLISINDPENLGTDLFGMKLSYNENIDGLTKNVQFNGNINAIVWNAKNYNRVQGYGFDYDGISRLTEADYSEKAVSWDPALNKYDVSGLTYDQNGNIESLNREGQVNQIDALDYDYSGNQLVKVTDFAIGADTLGFKDGVDLVKEYLYDANGNMVVDENKGIDTIFYNHMNLPEVIYFGDMANENYLEYVYNASGAKMIKYKIESGIVMDSTHYVGSFIYNKDSLGFVMTDEGRLTPSGNGNYQYEYFIKDHLGNNRVSFKDSSGVAVLTQEDHYYPFGMTMNGLSYVNGIGKNKYLYNGKEMQDDAFGGTKLDWYDYGFRMYDPTLARWHVSDPMAERRIEWSTYAYVLNNPIMRIDLFGLTDYTMNKRTGDINEVVYDDDDEQEANQAAETDRIVKSKRNGEVKRKKNGTVKSTSVKDIKKGILNDGQNFETESNIIAVGGEEQPSEHDVEAFTLKLSTYVGKEIGGAYFANGEEGSTSHITLGKYQNNTFKKSGPKGHTLGLRQGLTLKGFFHTHPSANINNSDRLVPSDTDLDARDRALEHNSSLRFFILTSPVNYGDPDPNKIPYTTRYSHRLR